MKQIVIDENNAVIGFCEGDGYVDGGINVEYYPDRFIEEFAPEKWFYIDGEYILNPDYTEPAEEPANNDPSADEIINVILGVSNNG